MIKELCDWVKSTIDDDIFFKKSILGERMSSKPMVTKNGRGDYVSFALESGCSFWSLRQPTEKCERLAEDKIQINLSSKKN